MTKTFRATVRATGTRICVVSVLQNPDGPILRSRDGGKPAAAKLLKVCKPKSKRADFLRWFLETEDGGGRTIGAAMANLKMSRNEISSYWYIVNREHGIGYSITNNTITPLLPPNCDPADVFGA